MPSSVAGAPPWLTGLELDGDASSRSNTATFGDAECGPRAAFEVVTEANISPAAGRETVVASYTGGIRVRGAEGQLLASAPGYPCLGNADELEQIVVGRAWGRDILGFVVTTGGHREAITWLVLYRLSPRGEMHAMFSGVIETYRDGVARRGDITMLADALVHREPSGERVLWILESTGSYYLPYPLSSRELH